MQNTKTDKNGPPLTCGQGGVMAYIVFTAVSVALGVGATVLLFSLLLRALWGGGAQ